MFVQEVSATTLGRQAWGCGKTTPCGEWYFVLAATKAPFRIEMTYRGDYMDTAIVFKAHIARLDRQVRPFPPSHPGYRQVTVISVT